MVGFSRFFISNPDLVLKLKNNPSSLVKYDRKLFYEQFNWGYNTYGQDQPVDEEKERKKFPKVIGNIDEARL